MAYAAVVSLVQTLQNLKKTANFYPEPQIEHLDGSLRELQSDLDRIFPVTSKIKDDVLKLEKNIRNAVYEAQDEIESFQLQAVSSESGQIPGDLQEIIDRFVPIAEEAKKVAKEAGKILPETQGGGPLTDDSVSSKSAATTKTLKIIGQEEDFKRLMGELISENNELVILPINGMPGIGKTTLARSLYTDKRVEEHFLARGWVTVTSESNFGDIFTKLLASIDTRGQKAEDSSSNKLGAKRESDDDLSTRLYQKLHHTRYLIVVDDMWYTETWDRMRRFFPDNHNGSRIILTTRDAGIAKYVNSSFNHEMKPLSFEHSWELLCDRTFGDGKCPPYLEKEGKKITANCGGLPLSLTVIGGQLSQESKTVEYWSVVEQDINDAVKDREPEDRAQAYMEILTLSYNHLRANFKGGFLYMGGFPEDCEILVSKLIRLWVAEGFLTLLQDQILEEAAAAFLTQLINRNLLSVRKFGSNGKIKSCGIHDILRDLAMRECGKDKFFHGIKRYAIELEEGVVTQRRLSVHKNILMCMEEVYNSASTVKHARSFLFMGSHHHHPYPYSLTFEYLRVLDALTVYFIEFPNEVLKLIHLAYLSLTYNGRIPDPLCKLLNLQVLIVRQHPKIIFLDTSLLPEGIWKMPQLRHLWITETELPKISGVEYAAQNTALLENLQSLTNVNAASCTKEVLGRFPNVKHLEMWVEGPGSLDFFIDTLEDLDVFKFKVLNPIPGKMIEFNSFALPKLLTKLSLSGCGLPWEDMSTIGQLEHLLVLKLREFAFQGQCWEPIKGEFTELKYLLLEGMDFEYWDAEDSHFPSLETLIIRHCYDLEEIPLEIGDIGPLELIELVDCSPSATDSARVIKQKQEEMNRNFKVRIYASWE